uniref:Uncharacterized protein n=1 Tax=Moniliophthora roreri TaxID=221103 RepID=A0A0W0G8G9_MONRR
MPQVSSQLSFERAESQYCHIFSCLIRSYTLGTQVALTSFISSSAIIVKPCLTTSPVSPFPVVHSIVYKVKPPGTVQKRIPITVVLRRHIIGHAVRVVINTILAPPQSREPTQSASFSPPPRTQMPHGASFARRFDSSSRPPPSVQNTSNYERRTMSGNYNTRVIHSSDEFLEAVAGTGMFNNCSNVTFTRGSTVTVGTQINCHYRHTENNVRSGKTIFMDFHSDLEDRYSDSEEVLDESGEEAEQVQMENTKDYERVRAIGRQAFEWAIQLAQSGRDPVRTI